MYLDEETWWPYGINCLINVLHGVLADDVPLTEDKIICEYEEYKEFRQKIALNIYKKTLNSNTNEYEYLLYKNDEDEILNDNIRIDFEKEIIILINSARIKDVYYSKIFECYLIIYDTVSVEKNVYSLAICNKFDKSIENKYIIGNLNNKPECLNIDIDRPQNNNDVY